MDRDQEPSEEPETLPPPSSSGTAAAAAATATATASSAANKNRAPGFLKRILELLMLVAATLAALFFFKEAEDANAEKLKLERELRRVKGRRSEDNAGKCAVCLDNPLELALEPCGHVCLCRDCGAKVERCPVCRAAIDRRREVFLAS